MITLKAIEANEMYPVYSIEAIESWHDTNECREVSCELMERYTRVAKEFYALQAELAALREN